MEKELAGIIIILSFIFIGYVLYLMLVAASDEDDLRDELIEKEDEND
jgi:hypothetical protein